jgi:pyruvate/2-oxoglutarate dehydrogenase complex dihydrolipoamide dehydrogenase (E3) component
MSQNFVKLALCHDEFVSLQVKGKYNDGTDFSDEFDTVVFAIGRDACTSGIGLDKIGVKLNPKVGISLQQL